MKTAVSLPADLFARAERLARRLKKSRSGLYREAIAEYLARHDVDRITASLNEVYAAAEPTDPFLEAAARRVLERTEW